MKTYRSGDKITSLDELMKQELVYFNHKITNKGWFQNWQIGWANRYIQRGFVRKAIKYDEPLTEQQIKNYELIAEVTK